MEVIFGNYGIGRIRGRDERGRGRQPEFQVGIFDRFVGSDAQQQCEPVRPCGDFEAAFHGGAAGLPLDAGDLAPLEELAAFDEIAVLEFRAGPGRLIRSAERVDHAGQGSVGPAELAVIVLSEKAAIRAHRT